MPLKMTAFTSARKSGTEESAAPPTAEMPCLASSCPSIAAFWSATEAPSCDSTPAGRRSAAAIDHALSADLDDRGIRQDPEVRRRFCGGQKLWIGERALHEQPLELGDGVRHPRHPLAFCCSRDGRPAGHDGGAS